MKVSKDWIGHGLGLKAPKLRVVGKATISDGEVPPLGEVREETVDLATGKQMMAMGPDHTIYKVEVAPDELRKLGQHGMDRGLNGGGIVTPPPSISKGWSNGTDQRRRWRNSNTDWPRDTIGSIASSSTATGHCTGTLFDDGLVLTAFHCLWDGNGNWVGANFRAGRDGSTTVYPEVAHTWKFWDQGFIDNNCHNWLTTGYRTVCRKYDWAVLVLAGTPTTSTGVTPSYMGYYYNSSDTAVAGYTMYHFGYPGCTSAGAPVGCSNNSMWGQMDINGNAIACGIGSFSNAVGSFNRNFAHGCDASTGHSGGPLYSWSPGSSGPYIVATNISESCAGSACTSATPNTAFRLDQWLGDQMTYWRSIY